MPRTFRLTVAIIAALGQGCSCGGPTDAQEQPYDAGVETECGDGLVGGDEQCDDANELAGDGCSATCTRETSCELAVDLLEVAQVDAQGKRTLSGDLRLGQAQSSASCGGAGKERVFRYRAPAPGRLDVRLESNDDVVVYAREDCSTSAELRCSLPSRGFTLELTSGQTVFLVVDSGDGPKDGLFTLTTQFRVARPAGAACDVSRATDLCVTGHRCESDGSTGVCVANAAPVIGSATALMTGRSAEDLFIEVSGTDADGDVEVVGLAAFDATNAPVKFVGRDAKGAPTDAEGVASFDAPIVSQTTFAGTFTWRGFFKRFPQVKSLAVWVEDSGELASERLTVSALGAPAAAPEQPCDVAELENVCTRGFLCRGLPARCQASAPPVIDRGEYLLMPSGASRLLLDVTDSDQDIVWVSFLMQDAGGQPVGVDLTGDGAAETSGSVRVTQTAASDFLEIDTSEIHASVSRLVVTLYDWSGLASVSQALTLRDQPEAGPGAACDTRWKYSRCPSGHACAGQPATCVAGHAPGFTQAAYLRAGTGAYILLEGVDPDEDVARLRVEYLSDAEQPVPLFDSNGDGLADASAKEFSLESLPASSGGAFFAWVDASDHSAFVPRVALTMSDRAGLTSARTVLTLANRTVKAQGQPCSVNGLDACVSDCVCAPVAGFAGECRSLQDEQTAACTGAVVSSGTGTVAGATRGPSLWDPPSGCSPRPSRDSPEAVVRLSLLQSATSLRVSTDNPGTNFDSVLYVLPVCGVAASLACHDDVDALHENFRSTVTLNDVSAGDYLIVIDSLDGVGGSYELTVAVQ